MIMKDTSLTNLLANRENLEHILDNLQDGIIAHDLERRIFYFNRMAEEITGYKREEVIGRDCHEALDGGLCGSRCSFCGKEADFTDHIEYTVTIATKDGDPRRLEMSVTMMKDENGHDFGILASFKDVSELHKLRLKAREAVSFGNIVGRNNKMRDVFQQIIDVAPYDSPVHIHGETGTGKELVAGAIHEESRRSGAPFVPINCGALPEGLIESELFGHVKGAFTGAIQTRAGRFKQAHGGTLLLDEIGCMSPAGQAKLLRVLQEHEYQPVGSSETLKSNVRILASTNINLEKAVKNGLFREDLFYRLNVFSIQIAPLRERKADIPLLAQFFLNKYVREIGKKITTLAPETIQILMEYDWPGNVRELENSIEHAVILEKKNRLLPHSLPRNLSPAKPENTDADWATTFGLREKLTVLEKQIIIDSLIRANWIKKHAAELLQVDARNLPYLLKKHQIIETQDITPFC